MSRKTWETNNVTHQTNLNFSLWPRTRFAWICFVVAVAILKWGGPR